MRLLAVALAGTASLLASPASAQTRQTDTAALNWSRLPGTEACPDLAELARRVGQNLKRDAFVSPAKARVIVDASIQPAELGFRVRIVLSSSDQAAPGERELVSANPDCNDAVDSAALAIALMLDPDALTRGEEPAPIGDTSGSTPATSASKATDPSAAPAVAGAATSAPSAAAIAMSREPEPDVPSPRDMEPRKLGPTRLALGGLAASEQVPGNDFGVVVGLRQLNQARWLGLELEVSYLAPRRVRIRTGELEAGGEFSLLGMQLAGVWAAHRRAPLGLSLLAGAQVAQLYASGFGFTASNRDAESWMVSGTLEGEAAWALSERWELLVRLGLGVPFGRDGFEASLTTGTLAIFEPAPVFGTLKVGLAVCP